MQRDDRPRNDRPRNDLPRHDQRLDPDRTGAVARARVPRALAFGALTGAVSLLPLDRTPAPLRTGLIAATGLAAGAVVPAVVWRAISREAGDGATSDVETADAEMADAEPSGIATRGESTPDLAPEAGPAQTGKRPSAAARGLLLTGTGLAIGAAASGAVWFTFVADRASVRFIERLGSRHPRRWFALGGFVLGTVMEYFDTPASRERPARS